MRSLPPIFIFALDLNQNKENKNSNKNRDHTMNLLFSLALSVFFAFSPFQTVVIFLCRNFSTNFIRWCVLLLFFFRCRMQKNMFTEIHSQNENMQHSISRQYFQIWNGSNICPLCVSVCVFSPTLPLFSYQIQTPYNRLINVLQAVLLPILLLHSYFMCYLRAICFNSTHQYCLYIDFWLMK